MSDTTHDESGDVQSRIERDRQLITSARARGRGATAMTYAKLSGPGWLQGAITLGGGSLAGSLYLGVIGGVELMWLQPLMMVLGIVMLSAISYVALSTGERPFSQINRHISPALGWGWAIATLLANLVWAMPQFSLGSAALNQNLFPETFGGESGKLYAVVLLFVVAGVVVWFYDSGGWGVKLFELLLKIMVGIVVLSFFGVVVTLTFGGEGLAWGEILTGFIPNPGLLFEPAERFKAFIAESSDPEYWRNLVLSEQRDVMVAAAATAVGINMTFLLPYSMLKKGWDRDFRGLATFDLSIGLFIPFVLATSCVVIASASQFHGTYDSGLVGEGPETAITAKLKGAYQANLTARGRHTLGVEACREIDEARDRARELEVRLEEKRKAAEGDATGVQTEGEIDELVAKLEAARAVLGPIQGELTKTVDALPPADRRLAAMLVKRDAFLLANALEHLTGKTVAQTVFGIGVLGMALSTIIILMLINGFTVCEMLGRPGSRFLHRFGCVLPGLTGAFGALYLWTGKAQFWLAVPTSVFGMALLPIAYVTFMFMMNNRGILGESLPRGGKRLALNAIMLVAFTAASIGAGWSIWSKSGWYGVGGVVAFVALAAIARPKRRAAA